MLELQLHFTEDLYCLNMPRKLQLLINNRDDLFFMDARTAIKPL